MPSVENVPFRLLTPITWRHRITDRFNAPRNYNFAPDKLQLHEGIDYAPAAPINQPLYVRAAQRGVVNLIGFNPQGYGNYVRIFHEWGKDRYQTWYGHLAVVLTKEGEYVHPGETIGIAGSTGFSTGTHLHLTLQHLNRGLENYVVDDVVDPDPYLVNALPEFDEMWWIKDVTIPDGTTMQPGERFRKVWRVRNAGNTTWRSGYSFVHVSGDPMGTDGVIPLPFAMPGDEVNIAIDLIAPFNNGLQRTTWRGRTPTGEIFTHDQYAEIVVQGAPQRGFSEMRYVADVTIPDGTLMQPGQPFTKVWRVRNSGETTWDEGYTLAHFANDPMGQNQVVSLPLAEPGDVVEVSVELVAPAQPGTHRSTWKGRDPSGAFFPFEMYAEIVVSAALNDDAAVVDLQLALMPGARAVLEWRVRNIGQSLWDENFALTFTSGERLNAPARVPLVTTAPGGELVIEVPITAPALPGEYTTTWTLRDAEGNPFGAPLTAQITVQAEG